MEMKTRHYWEENGHAVKYENYNSNDGFTRAPGCSDQLNFAAPSEDEVDYQNGNGFLKKGKVSRQDPMSHRIIEKRRRDRMNNCLADLSRLIPPEYLKKGRGRVEKTEIIEMAIRHLKYLQERANGLYQANKGKSEYGGGSPAELYKVGFQDAAAEAVRFLVEVQGHGPGDGLCVQMASHLQRHCDHLIKSEQLSFVQEKSRLHGSSSETASSSGSYHEYSVKAAVIARTDIRADIRTDIRDDPVDPIYADSYETAPADDGPYPGDFERPPNNCEESMEALRKNDTLLRAVRKIDTSDDYLHSYKFKNSIERRFSRSQDYEVHDMSVRAVPHAKALTHKRRRTSKPIVSTSTSNSGSNCGSNSGSNSGRNSGSNSGANSGRHSGSNSGSNEDVTDTWPQDTCSESPHHHYDKPALPTQYVPVFALNALGKYYVPLSVEYGCLSRQAGHPAGALAARGGAGGPLHPITIHVNFQSCGGHLKREPDPHWDERSRAREHNYTPH